MFKSKSLKSHLLLVVLFFVVTLILLSVFGVYRQENYLSVQVSKKKQIVKGDKIILTFSTRLNGRYNLNNIKVSPRLQISKRWLNNRQIELKIVEATEPNQQYQVKLHQVPTFWFNFKKDFSYIITSPKTPSNLFIIPQDKEKEVDYYTPIVIKLNKKLDKGIYLSVLTNPKIETKTQVSNDRLTISIIPKKELAKAQKYEINIYAKCKDKPDFNKRVYQGSFTTKIPPRVIYNLDKNGQPIKTEDIVWEIKPKIVNGKYIDIDLTHQVLSIFQDGLRKASYKVSTGKRGMNTPTGIFKILSKGRRPWSAHYGLYMPWYMGFTTKGHGIHELPEWPSGYKEGANHLGIPVSHGCVRLGVGPAKIVYDFTPKGTPVVVHY